MAKSDLTAPELRANLHYDADTGVFTRLVASTGRRSHIGAVCGSPDRKGHIYIYVLGKRYAAHRLAWLYRTGEWPKDQIDHINGAKADNRFENLREADSALNIQNERRARSSSLTGVLGVSAKGNRFRAGIRANGKQVYLGSFLTIEEAQAAYVAAKRIHHAGCTI